MSIDDDIHNWARTVGIDYRQETDAEYLNRRLAELTKEIAGLKQSQKALLKRLNTFRKPWWRKLI